MHAWQVIFAAGAALGAAVGYLAGRLRERSIRRRLAIDDALADLGPALRQRLIEDAKQRRN